MLADAEDAENDFAPVLADQYDLHASLPNDEQRIARVVLEQDHAATRIKLLSGQLGEPFELESIEAGEQRNGGQEIGCSLQTGKGRRKNGPRP